MLLPQTKEREYRFKLALRMGLPIFSLVILLIFTTLYNSYETLNTTFYFESILLLTFSIYFIFYLIYNGFSVRITDPISKTFTREFLYSYIKEQIKKNESYTLILISVDNLHDINTTYGIKNGDNILYQTTKWIAEYLDSKGIRNFPLGHIKGGDFILGLPGSQNEHNTLLELMCIKSDELNINNIEVKVSGAIVDTSYSKDIEYLIEHLFEIQNRNRTIKQKLNNEQINPSELESLVINSIKNKSFIVMAQDVFENGKAVIRECSVKLKTENEKILHQKSYMKVINRLGLGVEYDLMILEQNLNNCNKLDKKIYALNISPASLRNHKFISRAKELIQNNSHAKDKIMFILNEPEYYSHIGRYNSILNSFRDLGVLIAVDRLGALNSSFLYLRDLNIDIVRFDSLYIKDEKYKYILDGFNTMAHQKNIKTWIKMIEDESSKKLVNKLNINYLQGKYLAPVEKLYES